MKHLKLFFALFAMLALGVTNAWGDVTCDFTAKSASHNAYTDSWSYGDFTVFGGANNNGQWAYVKMGGKKETLAKANPVYITSPQMKSSISKVQVSIYAGSLPKTGMSVNSWGVYVYSDENMTTQIDYVAGGTIDKTAKVFEFTPSKGTVWAANNYYKVSFDLANTSTTNGIIWLDKITFVESAGEGGGETPEVPIVAAPTFSIEAGTYTEAQEVTLSAAEGTIHYTLDGTTPNAESTEYTVPIVLDECGTTTIKAIAISGENTSSVASATYTIKLPLNNSQANPYTEAEAIAVYDGGCYDNQDVYVMGVVQTAQFFSKSNTYTITLEGGFQFYKFYEAAGETAFTADYIVAGDTLVACGKLVKYNTTYELGAGCYLVERKPYSAPKVDISNTPTTAYTVAQAIALIDDITSDLTKQVYVKGQISEVESFNASYGSITYWIKDEEGNTFQCYSGLGLNGAKFASVDDLVVGSQVVVYGTLKKHNSTYEFDYNNYIVSLTLPSYTVTATAENGTVEGAGEYEHGTEVTLTATPADGYKFTCWTSGKDTVSIENPYTFTVTADVALVANFKELVTETIYFVNNKGWENVNVYAWTTEINAEWPGVAATKETEQICGYNVYSYTAEAGAYAAVIFNNGSDQQTADLVWTAGKYYVQNGWYTREDAEALLAGTDIPSVITYVLRGVGGDWTVGIALTVNPDNENEYVLLGQDIAEGDAVKVVTLTDGQATAWCGNVDKYSVAHSFDKDGNIVLAPGKYDFYFKVNENLIYIAAVEPEVIEYVLNGGQLPLVGPTNAELWEAFKPYYNTYYGLTRSDQSIDKVSTFANAYMQKIMTDEASEYKWLGDYVLSVATAAGVKLSTDMAAANEGGWRWAVHAFFNAAAGQYGATGIDFTEAGKPENWVNVYPDATEVELPTIPVAEDYVLPTPTKTGCTFKGWYDNAEGTGDAYTVIPAGWSGTLYAIWKQGTATALENIAVEGKAVKAIVNGQLIIIKNGVQYNAQGQVIK